ncbi:MAG: type II secretion system F family protein [Myxococcaceae bacterium]
MSAAVIVLLAGGAVFFLSLVVLGVLGKALATYRERYVVKSIADLSAMFLFIEPRQLLALNAVSTILFSLLGLLALGSLAAVAWGIAGFFLPNVSLRLYKRRRIRKFNQQLVDALQTMANAFKAGLTFPQAVENVAPDSQPPLSQELGLFLREVKLGKSVEDALNDLSARVGSTDLELMVTSTNIARQLSGNLAEIFETISATIRERFRIEGKIDALTSQGRMQGWIVASLPVALGLTLDRLRPDLMQPMFEHAFGYVLVGLIAGMELLGILLIRRIVNIHV